MSVALCPICKKPIPQTTTCPPFCSKRCKEIDLGEWALEKRRIAGKDGEAGALGSEELLSEYEDEH